MKICMVVPNAMVKGGIASVVNGYRGSQLEKDCEITYVESYCDGTKLKKLLKAIRGYFSFVWVLMFYRPDLVHIHSSFGPSFYRKIPFIVLSNWFRKPVVNHIHGAEFDVFYRNASVKKKALIRKIYNRCDKFIALSVEWKENLSEIVPIEKIAVVSNYSQLNYEAFQERKSRKTNNRVLFLGELGERKGCFDIPKVVKQVVQKVPNVKFVLAGDGSNADKLAIRQLIYKEGVEKNVILLGWIRGDEKDQQLKDADLLFLPSYNEGMPMSVLDAMGYGLPVVSTNVGGIPKIVVNGLNGYCCNPGDIEAFSNDIISILKSERLQSKYSEESYQIVMKKYSLASHIEKIEQVYMGCIK